MRFNTILIFAILMTTILASACGTETVNDAPTNATANTNMAPENKDPLATAKTPEISTTNDAPTFSPIVKAYCEAIIKKDDAALRKLHSRETLAIYDADMKNDKKTSLAEFLSDLEPITDASKCGARNEKIEGDRGSARIRNQNMPNGVEIVFVNENGEWKITNKSPEFDSVKKSASNSNSGN